MITLEIGAAVVASVNGKLTMAVNPTARKERIWIMVDKHKKSRCNCKKPAMPFINA